MGNRFGQRIKTTVRISIIMKGINELYHRRGDVWEGNAYIEVLSTGMSAGLESG